MKAILVGAIGNLVEWYDVYAYAAFALYFAPTFFPKSNPVAAQLAAALLFALAYLVRPLGSIGFGYLADRYGRRNTLTASILLMCLGSLMIALCPGVATIGVAAPIILAFARVIQGLSQGGEYGTSATYLSEQAKPEHRGFYSGIWYTTLAGGQLCALLVLFILQKLFLSPDQLNAWGWRIPFLLGAALALWGLVMRRAMPETDLFLEARRREAIWPQFLRQWRGILFVVGITIGGTSAFYTYTTYMQKFLKLSVGLRDEETTLITAGSLLFAILLQPLYGALSDRIGRKPQLIAFGILGSIGTYPLLSTLYATRSALTAFCLICAAFAIVSLYTSITATVKAELFPTEVRALGVGVPYAVTVALFGGSIDSVALWFKTEGMEQGFFWYASACILASLPAYLLMPETSCRKRSKEDRVMSQTLMDP
ncbi:MAG TPA: MFS transporter [Stellaceae bacterium]|nr:MFS transporter [Stellaceae bacterium]